jgi:hypothetical protein
MGTGTYMAGYQMDIFLFSPSLFSRIFSLDQREKLEQKPN